ncbi:DNA gyrase subunit A [Arthrobacter sp. Hiyo4]|nr:DNA gyrase subunit A [Arthrobacter sp. Hiyo4]
MIEKIKDAVNGKKLTGISDIVDLTDRQHGLRLVIELKNGFNPNAVLQQLYRYSPMEDSFGINNVTLVDGQPQTLGLVKLLSVYVEHRIDVVRRRTSFRLGKKKDRLHLVEGLLIAIVDIDEVIQIIRSSDEVAAARVRLMSIYDLSEIQANYILELRLRQLTKYSRIELEKEQEELRREIAELEAILGSEERLRGLVSSELGEIAEKYGTPRRTVLLESEAVSPPWRPPWRPPQRQRPGRAARPGDLGRSLLGHPDGVGPDRAHVQPGAPRRVRTAGQARRFPYSGQDLGPRGNSGGHLTGPDAAASGHGHAGAAADVRPAQPRRRCSGPGLHHAAEG